MKCFSVNLNAVLNGMGIVTIEADSTEEARKMLIEMPESELARLADFDFNWRDPYWEPEWLEEAIEDMEEWDYEE